MEKTSFINKNEISNKKKYKNSTFLNLNFNLIKMILNYLDIGETFKLIGLRNQKVNKTANDLGIFKIFSLVKSFWNTNKKLKEFADSTYKILRKENLYSKNRTISVIKFHLKQINRCLVKKHGMFLFVF